MADLATVRPVRPAAKMTSAPLASSGGTTPTKDKSQDTGITRNNKGKYRVLNLSSIPVNIRDQQINSVRMAPATLPNKISILSKNQPTDDELFTTFNHD